MKSKEQAPSARSDTNYESDGIDMGTVPRSLKRPAGFFKRHRNNFFMMGGVLILGFVLNSLATDVWTRYVSPWKGSDDVYIKQLTSQQKQQFQALHASLADIKSSLPAEGREAFDALQRSLANVERDSAGLVTQLDLAQKELATLRTIAVDRGGLGSGYDFTLAANSSMDLAPGAIIGLTRVSAGGARVNLTSGGSQAENDRYLRSGESLTYQGIDGRDCWVSLSSLREGRPGAASFKADCKS